MSYNSWFCMGSGIGTQAHRCAQQLLFLQSHSLYFLHYSLPSKAKACVVLPLPELIWHAARDSVSRTGRSVMTEVKVTVTMMELEVSKSQPAYTVKRGRHRSQEA